MRKPKKKRSVSAHSKKQSAPTLLTFFDWLNSIPPKIFSLKGSITLSKKLGFLFVVLGFVLIVLPRIANILFESEPAVAEEVPIKADTQFVSIPLVQKTPVRIIIPDLQIDIPITRSKLINGYWEVSEKTASFGDGSAPPGEIGNTVVFAHAREGLFLPLKNITYGKEIYVLTSNQWFHYRVDEIREVNPTDVYVVQRSEDNRLTLFTCSGFLDQKRLVVIAKPVK